jgi:hypothetical protein
MSLTTLRFFTSSANSLADQWRIGRPDFSGGSQAMATIWTICSGLKVAGPPGRHRASGRASGGRSDG